MLKVVTLLALLATGAVASFGRDINNQAMTDKEMDLHRPKLDTATFGEGCFWCTEVIFEQLKGVIDVESGYSGGKIANPTYREVCSGLTGHAEVIQVTYDPAVISYEDLLRIHLSTHNPTTLNYQGADHGSQYRSIILVSNQEQRNSAEKIIAELASAFDQAIVTEVKDLEAFYVAEPEHQDFYVNNPDQGYCQAVINPKLDKFTKLFRDKMK